MEKRIKKRLALLGILLIAGLLIAGLFIILGVPVKTMVTSSEGFSVTIEGSQGTIYKDGKVLQTLPFHAAILKEKKITNIPGILQIYRRVEYV